jgi:fermentation-respiration switch protein FrsA (DUF1100 family)
MVVGDPDMQGVSIERVTYPNIAANTVIAANLFKPAGFDGAKRHAAIVVGHPFGGVKEQTAGLHALAGADGLCHLVLRRLALRRQQR